MSLDPTYTQLWIVLLGLCLILEISALLKPKGTPNGTLTWNIRTLLRLYSRHHWAGRIIAALILGWLCWHFLNPVQPY